MLSFPRSSLSLCWYQEKHLCFFDKLLLMRIAWSGLRSSTLEHVLQNLVLTPNSPDIAIKIDLLWGKLEKLTEVEKKSSPIFFYLSWRIFQSFPEAFVQNTKVEICWLEYLQEVSIYCRGVFLGLFHFEWILAEGKAYGSQLL